MLFSFFFFLFFFFSSRRRHTRSTRDWSSDVCSSDLFGPTSRPPRAAARQAIVGRLIARSRVLADPRPPSLRCYLRRHVDPMRRRFPKRMRCKIVLSEQRLIGRPARISERLLIATFWIRGGRQVTPVAMCAGHPRSTLKARIELVRAGRLTETKSSVADVNSHGDWSVRSCNIAGEERARNCGGAKDGPGPQDSGR